MTVAWLFPGQGSQAVGMGKDLAVGAPAARRMLELADDALGFQLTRLLFEGPAEELQQTINTQPAVVAVSLAALAGLREAWSEAGRGELPPPAFVAGHSVGEYAALVASGAADEATGLRLVLERARLMQRAGEASPGGMVAVIGLRREAVAEACRQARQQVSGSYVDVANHNAETQVTIAGDPQGLAAASKLCQAAGARRCVTLAVSAAFHSRAMAQAAAQLAAQVAKPVLWADSVQRMVDAGVTAFIEFGHGSVLTNLVERMAGGLSALAIGDTAGVRAAVDWLPAHLA
jgi:[acyl-carrier-protein] S-malonyltransferase